MTATVTIEVRNEEEAAALRAGLADDAVRAFVLIVGALSVLPSDRARKRVLHFVADQIAEDSAR